MSWVSVVGQQRVKQLLMKAIGSGRMPHAYLFYGPEGVGKDAMAIELAKVVNCEQEGVTACDRCDSCLRFDSLQHPNLRLTFSLPIGKGEKSGDPPLAKLSNEDIDTIREQIRLKANNRYHTITVPRATTIKVNSIRDVKREVSLTTYTKGKKVIIIIDAENMNDEAANALLKTLEEPADDTLFILTTSYRDQLFPTVVSRCQGVRFDLLTENEIATYLAANKRIDSSRAMLIARLAHGSMSRAMELLDVDLQEQRKKVINFLRTLHSGNELELSEFLEELVRDYDRDEMQRFLQLLQLWIRDGLCVQEGYESIINVDQKESIHRFVKRFFGLNYSELMSNIDNTISLISKNAYIPLALAVLSLNMRKYIARS